VIAVVAVVVSLLQGPAEVIADIRVHGNHIATSDEVIAIAGVAVGAPFTDATIADVTRRLDASGKFDDVQVLKRFASIEDPSRIALVIIVNEGPVRLTRDEGPDGDLRVVRRRWLRNLMFMPILDAEDGYGFTYGVRLAYVDVAGERSRLSFPLTLGGTRQAGAELERNFDRGPFSRLQAGGAVRSQRNPAFDERDHRERVWGRVEKHVFGARLRAGGGADWQRVSFGDLDDDLRTIEADVTFDTRLDPLMPRNAVYARAGWERVSFESGGVTHRWRLDGRGYVGLIGQTVLVVRAQRLDSDRPLPPYLKPLLGGWSSLRGFKAGAFVDDTLVSGSAELRIPLTTPLSVGRVGVSAFVDTGAVYPDGARFRDATLRTGAGGSIWLTATAFQISLGVAHGRGSGTRVNFGGGFVF
jgi:outer membrane protein assembly factor BamA